MDLISQNVMLIFALEYSYSQCLGTFHHNLFLGLLVIRAGWDIAHYYPNGGVYAKLKLGIRHHKHIH